MFSSMQVLTYVNNACYESYSTKQTSLVCMSDCRILQSHILQLRKFSSEVSLYLSVCSVYNGLELCWRTLENRFKNMFVGDVILLKPVQKWCWCSIKFRLFKCHYTLKFGINTAWFKMSPNGNVSI